MKTGLFLTALVQLAAAQPHNNRHAHMHAKRDVVTQVVTATAPDAVVWVNQDGTPVSTSFVSDYAAKPTPVHATYVTPAAAPAPAPVKHHKHKHADTNAAVAAPAPAPAPAHKHHHHNSGTDTGASSPLGIDYTPYNADGSCKSQSQVSSDFQTINGYGLVRIYGVDCEQLVTVPTAAKAKGMQVMVGAYNWPDYQGDVQAIIGAFKGDWSSIYTVSIGNELVNGGQASASDVAQAVNSARGTLRGAGYSGPVVTVDTFSAILANTVLCQASDYAAANAHAFFDADITAPQAGSWAQSTANQLQQACNKRVVITESGWPHSGSANGAAVPGVTEQQQAISSLKSHFPNGGLFIFEAFDNLWKSNNAFTFNAEQFWGIYPGQ